MYWRYVSEGEREYGYKALKGFLVLLNTKVDKTLSHIDLCMMKILLGIPNGFIFYLYNCSFKQVASSCTHNYFTSTQFSLNWILQAVFKSHWFLCFMCNIPPNPNFPFNQRKAHFPSCMKTALKSLNCHQSIQIRLWEHEVCQEEKVKEWYWLKKQIEAFHIHPFNMQVTFYETNVCKELNFTCMI